MGLDVYAGTLARYYAGNWKTILQQWGEANGVKVHVVRAQEQTEETAPPEEIERGVRAWRDGLTEALSQAITSAVLWQEDCDTTPYYTDKPDWTAVEALMLFVCCHVTGEALPATIRKDFVLAENKVYQHFMQTKEGPISLFDSDNWWLPIGDAFIFSGCLPTGEEKVFATVGSLRQELENINALEWKADEKTILEWTNSEGYPDDGCVGKYGLQIEKEHQEYDTVSLAKLAFSILWRAVRHSEQYGTLIIYDY